MTVPRQSHISNRRHIGSTASSGVHATASVSGTCCNVAESYPVALAPQDVAARRNIVGNLWQGIGTVEGPTRLSAIAPQMGSIAATASLDDPNKSAQPHPRRQLGLIEDQHAR